MKKNEKKKNIYVFCNGLYTRLYMNCDIKSENKESFTIISSNGMEWKFNKINYSYERG